MSRVHIVALPTRSAGNYRWRWVSNDGASASAHEFDLFFECLEDARKHGHEVELRAPDVNAVNLALEPPVGATERLQHPGRPVN